MFRRIVILGLVVALVSALATVAALRSSSDDADAQVNAYPMNQLCLELTTSLYKGAYTPNCPPGHLLRLLPDDYPISLCASAYDGFLRAPNYSGNCPPATAIRIDLPSETPVNVCFYYFTGRLGLPKPFPNGTCSGASFLVTFPTGFDGVEDTYQTLGNVDIDVPVDSGLLSNDQGSGLLVTAFDAASANGGEVNVNPDGSFTYIPPAPNPNAFIGDDSFTYDVEDANGIGATVIVTIEVLNPTVWFVDADAPVNGDGRRETPFNDIAEVNDDGNDPDQSGDFIFLFESSDSYNAELDLEEGQYLVGQEVDLAEILQAAIEGSTLLGADATILPAFIVTPAENPTGEMPGLKISGIALTLADGSTAVGLTITSDFDVAVLAESVENATLDRVRVFGGVDFDGEAGVVVFDGDLTILAAEIFGGPGESTESPITASTTLLGNGTSGEGGNGGDGVVVEDGELFVSGSLINGGDGGNGEDFGGFGGNGIFIDGFAQVTVEAGSMLSGGNGGAGLDEGGDGGDGIGAFDFFLAGFVEPESHLQGGLETDAPFVDVSGASTAQGGNGGAADTIGGYGGAGIEAPNMLISLTEGSFAYGGNGGAGGGDFGGDGGPGIFSGGALTPGPLQGSSLQGVENDLVILTVDASTVAGGVGSEGGIEAGYGGDGIFVVLLVGGLTNGGTSGLQGSASGTISIDVNGSTVTGSAGGSGGATGGDGGWGIGLFVSESEIPCPICPSTLQGPGLPIFDVDLDVTNSDVSGGPGSAGDELGGWGGFGIANGDPFFFENLTSEPIPESRQLELLPPNMTGGNLTVSNSTVTGGAGGIGQAEEGGYGGPGIFSAGEFSLAGLQGLSDGTLTTTISDSDIDGGNGGFGQDGGFGGDALAVFGMDVLIDQNTTATGGVGANATVDDAGDGGYGIYAEDSTITVDSSVITGAHGGDNRDVGEDGYGGEGIYGFFVNLTVQNGSQVTGGDSGASNSEEGKSAPGGDGIFAEDSNVTVTGSTVTGGLGGFGDGVDGGDGGHGVHVAACFLCNTLTVTNATITGGDGGSSAVNEVGAGGEGVIVENDNATITGSMIASGNAGAVGDSTARTPALVVFFDDGNDYDIVIQGNTLTVGSGETSAPSLFALQGGLGSVCIDASGNLANADFELDNVGGTLGITQESLAAMGTANNGVTVNSADPIAFNCVVVQN